MEARIDYASNLHGRPDMYATIDTDALISERCDVDEDLTEAFAEWYEAQEAGDESVRWRSSFDDGRLFMESRGYKCEARDNTYNGESDLSYDFVWEVWLPSDSTCPEWIYAGDEAVIVIYRHRGGDPRGNYGGPEFFRSNGEYATPAIDVTAEWYIVDARRGNAETPDRWFSGYSSWPTGEMLEDVVRIFTHTVGDGSSVCVLLSDGRIAEIAPGAPYWR